MTDTQRAWESRRHRRAFLAVAVVGAIFTTVFIGYCLVHGAYGLALVTLVPAVFFVYSYHYGANLDAE